MSMVVSQHGKSAVVLLLIQKPVGHCYASGWCEEHLPETLMINFWELCRDAASAAPQPFSCDAAFQGHSTGNNGMAQSCWKSHQSASDQQPKNVNDTSHLFRSCSLRINLSFWIEQCCFCFAFVRPIYIAGRYFVHKWIFSIVIYIYFV